MRNHTTLPRRVFGLILLTGAAATAAAATDPIEEVGKTASTWVNTRAETVRIANAWTQDRDLLVATIAGLKERATRLEEKRDQLLATTTEERAEQAALTTKLTESRESLRLTETKLQALSDRVLRLRPMLPPRLSEALDLSYRSLAGKAGSPGERMQWVTTILNRCAQFNLTITQDDEVLTLAGEPGPKSVEVVYWGLSHGYALDRAAGKAWLGTPGSSGWQWEALQGAAPAVAELMAIRRDQAAPELVTVPARLKPAGTR